MPRKPLVLKSKMLKINGLNKSKIIYLTLFYRSRGLVFGSDPSGSGLSSSGPSLDLSEIRLGEATLVPVSSNRGELHHGLECRTVDGEILQLQLTRCAQLRLG